MRSQEQLVEIVREALDFCEAQPSVVAAEVFTSSNAQNVGRFNLTSHMPCNGLEEPKGSSFDGIGIFLVFKGANGIEIGFGSDEGGLDSGSVRRAFHKACLAKHHDPEFVSLPKPTGERRTLFTYHDPEIMDLSPASFTDACWRILQGAVEAALSSEKLISLAGGYESLKDASIIVGGDLTLLRERIAASSSVMRDVQTDDSTLAMAFLTSMVEKFKAKGSGYGTWIRLQDINGDPGRRSMENAINSIGGKRMPSGKHTVIFGAAAMADIIGLVLPSLSLGEIYAETSLFNEKLGERVAADHVELFDWGNAPGLVASKGITCEGLPTGKTALIRRGKFVGTLANWYESQRVLRDPKAKEKLGKDPREWASAFVPRNGFRFAERGGGRAASSETSPFGTNVILTSSEPMPFKELIRKVKKGLLIGRLWYVYPMGSSPKQGEFTGTLFADSYLIENGEIKEGLAVNSLRINDSLPRVLMNIQAMSEERETPLVWAADSVRHMPKGTLVADVPLEAISEEDALETEK